MQSILFLLSVAAFAGVFTVFGCAFTFVGKKSDKLLSFALSFAAGIMIGVSFTDLLPEALKLYKSIAGNRGILLLIFFMLTGVMFAKIIDIFIPKNVNLGTNNRQQLSLYRTGIISLIAIMMHKVPEGIAMFASGYHDIKLGLTIAIAIGIHNFPEGIAIAMPIYYSTGSRFKALKLTSLAACAEPFGVLIAAFILRPFINSFMLGTIFSFVIGIMFCIAFDELIPASIDYNHKNHSLAGILIGLCIMPLSELFI